jgi:hypothetical protein
MPVRSCGAACQVEMLDDTTLLLPLEAAHV